MSAPRGTLVVLGAGLIVLWIVGLGSDASNWLTWLDGIVGASSLIVAGVGFERGAEVARTASGWLVGVSIALFVLWIIGLASARTPAWIDWCTFGFGCAYLLTGLGFGMRGTRGLPTTRTV